MINDNNKAIYEDANTINFREFFEKFAFHWKWFSLGIITMLVLAFLYLRYTPRQYKVSATILVNDKNSGELQSELSAFQDLGIMSDVKSSFNNELGILKSRTLAMQVAKDLKLNISFYRKDFMKVNEVYKDKLPFKIKFLTNDTILNVTSLSFYIHPISETQFLLGNAEEESLGKFTYGETVAMGSIDFIVTPSISGIPISDEHYKVVILPIEFVANQFKNMIKIAPVDEKSSLIDLSIEYGVKQKAEHILNNLVKIYNQNAIIDKSTIAIKTNDFIGERLVVISKDLSLLDKSVEAFKTNNKITDVKTETGIILSSSSEINESIIALNTQLKLVDFVGLYINDNSEDLIPVNLGLSDISFSESTGIYNEILLERKRISKSSSTKNPVLMNLDEQLKNRRASISKSLVNLKSTLNISLQDLKAREKRIDSEIQSAPKQEREFVEMKRQQQIIETLYLYLLEKREENSITLAVTIPNSKIIDSAFGSNMPIFPVPRKVYFLAILIGMGIPFGVIFLIGLFDNKVHTYEDLERELKIPIIGDIPIIKSGERLVFEENERNLYAEAFHLLRTNINFMLAGIKSTSKTIFVTSTISGEGKTFTAINLAASLTLSNKKVLLVGADIRNPKLAAYLNVPLEKGLTHFLMDTELHIESVIQHIKSTNFDMIQSGLNAPNPSALLMNDRFKEVMAYGKKHYDFVIFDTPPVHVVADTLLLSENNADLVIYVVRANYLDKRLLKVPKKMSDEKRLPNMALVINGTAPKNGYGYGYYGYLQDDKSKRPWHRKI
ncbi:GumC family protein [Polaribacter sp. IC073]|uniref:GumC family protein n=1 Tax=Polaribacter sp. IC073 TaxID=2508540 RepID=UPI0011BF4E24|nr:tyrosine-protein kinase [Polaribacter sp. IC073]TXD47767.1 polysaccharide biosynthesis tyrosine autokinase [Polaribacter sp. IC073]